MSSLRAPLRMMILLAICAAVAGCPDDMTFRKTHPALLPRSIRLHPFTGTRQFSEGGGIQGIEARVEVIDHFGDPVKAFGTFRFEAYTYLPRRSEPRGQLLETWASDLSQPRKNLEHWDSISGTYRFSLTWDKPIPVGKRFVLRAVLSTADGPRLFDQLTLISGQ